MSHRHRIAGVALVLLAATSVLTASLPSFWEVSTQGDFLKGDVENLSVDSYGRLTLGSVSTFVLETTAPFLWTVARAPDGTLYVGSGNEGQVFSIDVGGASRVLFDADELEVHALAVGPTGRVYTGTSPDGKIYSIEPSGQVAVFFDPPDKYIWSLAVDRNGVVYAATGDKGIVYRITPDGTGAPFYATKATNAMALAFDAAGRLLVGTESPGRVFRIDASGRPFVLLDSAFGEIRSLVVGPDGVTYAMAVNRGARSGGGPAATAPDAPRSPAVPSVSAEITSITVAADVTVTAPASAPQTPRPASGAGAGAVYRISPEGVWDLAWESNEDTPYDLEIDADGSLLLATGNKGKIFRLSGDPLQPTLIARAPAQQVTAIEREDNGRIVYLTSNPGKVVRLAAERAGTGHYESEVRDTETIAEWGTIRWHGATPSGTRIELFTRSGNTHTPDDTWSPWGGPYGRPTGDAITSPPARYLQWKAVLTGNRRESPLLTSVTAAYLQRNVRPRVTTVTIEPPGMVFQKPFPTGEPDLAGFDGETPDRILSRQATPGSGPRPGLALGRRAYERGLLTFTWQADDGNGDPLVYDLLYRLEGETTWTTLRETLTEEIFVWDTTSVPDGKYVLRVVAQDTPSNPPAAALAGHRDSPAFDIDNGPPTVRFTGTRQDGARTVLSIEVRDEHSAVQKVEYSLDGRSWRPVYPRDGISDSQREEYELTVERTAATRGVVIRATDVLNNVTSVSSAGAAPAP